MILANTHHYPFEDCLLSSEVESKTWMILANTQHYPFEDCLLLSEVESAKVCPSNLGETMCLGKKWNASNRAPSVDEEF